jgi:hypothetical protein
LKVPAIGSPPFDDKTAPLRTKTDQSIVARSKTLGGYRRDTMNAKKKYATQAANPSGR